MAEEVSRTRSVRRITAPGNTGTYIDLKVTDEITFREERPPYQEWVLGFKNNPDDAARTVRVVEVGEDKLKVERIDTLDTTETTGIQQEAIWYFLNNQDPPVHLKTHKKKIYASDGSGTITDTGTWIEVQRVDEIEFEDQQDEVRGQESIWVLSNPDLEDEDDDYKNLTTPVTDWDGKTINPPWRLDPFQTIVDCSFSGFMLVLYQNNKIAWLPMASIATPSGKVTSKTLSQSNWSPQPWKSINSITNANRVKLCQVKISSSLHALSGNIAINADGVISVPDVSDQTPVFNVKDTLLKSGTSSTPWTDYNGNLADKEYVNPIINGSGTDLWNDRGDKFTWTQSGGITRVSTGDTLVKYRFNPSGSFTAVFDSYVLGVLPDGGRFSDIDVNLPYVSAFFWGNGFPITNAQFEILKTDVDAVSFIVNYGPGESDVTYTNSSSSAESFTATLDAHVQVYGKTAQGLDSLSMGTCSTTVSYDPGKFGLVPSIADPSATLTNYFGVNDYKMNTSGYEYLILRFPPALGNSQDNIYFYAANYDISPSIGYIQTPYGKYEYTGSASLRGLEGWLHASNGKHVLQGFDLTWGVSKMFLDGVDYGETLASAIGCSITDINAVILDVKKSDIDKLK